MKYILNGLKGIIAACIIAANIMYAAHAHAVSGGLAVSPTSVAPTVAPGDSYQGQMLVINQGQSDLTYTVSVTPYSVTGEDYQPYFTAIKGATDITKWFSFTNTGGALAAGDQITVPFTITVPKGTGAGGYYATVFAETSNKGTTGVVTQKRVGMIIYLRVSGDVIEKGSVDTWNVPWLQAAPLSATLKMSNEGSVYYPANVTVTVSDLFGSPKFSYTRDPEILPQKTRSIPVTWPNGATFGLFMVGGTVEYLGHTQKLPAHIVFIANTPMRLLTVAMLLIFIAIVVVGWKRVATRKK